MMPCRRAVERKSRVPGMEQGLVLFGHLWAAEGLIKQSLAALKDLQVDVPNILSVSEMRTHQPIEDHEIARCDCE